jgi:two-component system, NtrC family, nitrogen regulation sensor histidine kinase NtrY
MASERIHANHTRWFLLQVGARLSLLLVLMFAAAWVWTEGSKPATSILLASFAAALVFNLMRFVSHTNLEIQRLALALKHGDTTQSFSPSIRGAGFEELSLGLESLMQQQRERSNAVSAQATQLRSLIDHVPIALLVVDHANQVELLNNAARRLFPALTTQAISGLSIYGATLPQSLTDASVSIVNYQPANDAPLALRKTQSSITHRSGSAQLIALQPIQAELNASELALSQNMLRVLSHEVRNSLTPVMALTQTAAHLSNELTADAANETRIASTQQAISIAARRVEGLSVFVERFRALSRPLSPVVSTIAARALADDMKTLFETQFVEPAKSAKAIALIVVVKPADLTIQADRALLEQALINLLKNAGEAILDSESQTGEVRLDIQRTPSGHSLIAVEDSGPGVPLELRDDALLPFHTSKAGGSGIGLALARQIALAHGGSIQIDDSQLGGARVWMVM